MNVVYAGVGNDLFYDVKNADLDTFKLICEGCDSVVSIAKNWVKIWASNPGEINIELSNNDRSFYYRKNFRVKGIPNPVLMLTNGRKSGTINVEEFSTQNGIKSLLENFDYNVACEIVSFTLTRYRNGEIAAFNNIGSKFDAEILGLIKSTQKCDLFTITEIAGECPGDKQFRDLGIMLFNID